MLSLNKSYKNRKVSLIIHCKYKYFDSTVQRAEDRRQKFYFCRLPFAVNVKLNREVKHGVNGKRQTVTMKLLSSVFSSLLSRIEVFVFGVNSKRPKRHVFIFVSFI